MKIITLLSAQIYELLDKISREEIPVIVEGRNDKKALRELGIEHIFTLNKPLYKIIEELPGKEVVILTDFDAKGKQLYKKINHECSQRGFRVNNTLRLFLIRNTTLSHIEGFATFLRNLQEKEGKNKVCI